MTQAVLGKILVKFLCGIRLTGRADCYVQPQQGPAGKGGVPPGRGGATGVWLGLAGFSGALASLRRALIQDWLRRWPRELCASAKDA